MEDSVKFAFELEFESSDIASEWWKFFLVFQNTWNDKVFHLEACKQWFSNSVEFARSKFGGER